MSTLVLHSDQVEGKPEVEKAFLKLFNGKIPKMGYIPSQADDKDRTWFNKKCKWYAQFGITDILYFDIDKEYDKEKEDELFSCDAIFLSGGDTYYFLNSLRKMGFLQKLRDYVKKGGVLTGVSAGVIIMTPNIEICTLHDENKIGLKDFQSLGLVDFEFFPHLNHDEETYSSDLIEYSKKNNDRLIYACKDGEGIIVKGSKLEFIGNILKIQNGEISKAS